jgi:predicted dehydrogenase
MVRFAAVGIDHLHIFDHIKGLTAAGAVFAGYDPETTAPAIAARIAAEHPDVPRRDRAALFADPSIDVIAVAAIPRDRAGIAVAALRAGKDVMVDKPGLTTFAQLDDVRRAVADTGRIFSICFTERHCVRAAARASRLVAEGAVGRVVQTVGLGPHRLQRAMRAPWFFEPEAFGGILVDIASHQIDQFLHYTGSATGEVVASTIGNFSVADVPDFQDFGDMMLRSDRAAGYVRVDWLTPDALPTWGDGRLTILGTTGYIELRKYVDIAGRPGKDHLFLVNGTEMRHIDCSDEPLPYFGRFLADVADRTETAQTHAHIFEVCRLSLEAQARAVRIVPPGLRR